MRRRNFLSTIAALVAAPFVGKSLSKDDWKKANPVLIDRHNNVKFWYESNPGYESWVKDALSTEVRFKPNYLKSTWRISDQLQKEIETSNLMNG